MPFHSSESWLKRAWRAFEQWLFGVPTASSKKTRGQEAEDVATRYLKSKGYKILARNWRCRWGELDIVAEHDGRLVIVEVKSARSDEAYRAFTRVGQTKAQKLCKLGELFAKKYGYIGHSTQIDVVEVTFFPDASPKICHFEGTIKEEHMTRRTQYKWK